MVLCELFLHVILNITLLNGNVSGVTLCLFCRRTPTTVMVRESHVERMGSIQDVPYEILNVLEFNRCGLFVNLNVNSVRCNHCLVVYILLY